MVDLGLKVRSGDPDRLDGRRGKGADREVGQPGDERRVVVHRGRPLEADPHLAGDGLRLDVDVVEDLEVVGDEADRADDEPADARPGQPPDLGEDVRAEPGSPVRPALW